MHHFNIMKLDHKLTVVIREWRCPQTNPKTVLFPASGIEVYVCVSVSFFFFFFSCFYGWDKHPSSLDGAAMVTSGNKHQRKAVRSDSKELELRLFALSFNP